MANKHYWQVTDEDFDRAIQGLSKATQNTTQHLHVSARTGSQDTSGADEETLVLPVHAPQCTNVLTGLVGDTGLEPGPSYSEKTPPFEQGRYEGVIFPVPLSFGQAGLDHGVRVPSASVMLTTFGVLRTQHWTLYSVPFLRRPDRGRE